MRADCLFLVCLALLARSTLGADADADAVPAEAAAASSVVAASDAAGKEAEVLDVAESSNNNTAAADEDQDAAAAGGERSNTKRTIDHNLGYGYRYNTVLRPVAHTAHGMHYLPQPRRPAYAPHRALPPHKQRYPHQYFPSAASGSGGSSSGSGSSAPFRFSQPLPSPPQRPSEEVVLGQAQVVQVVQMRPQHDSAPMAPRPVTEAPSASGHGDVLSLYRTLPQPQPEQQAFAFDDDKAKPEAEAESVSMAEQAQAEAGEAAQPVQYADEAPHSYQQVLQPEPAYYLTSAATAPAATMFGTHVTAAPLAMYSQGHVGGGVSPLGHLGSAIQPAVMYATAAGGPHGAATQMIPVIIVRLMDPQSAASLGHAMTPMAHAHAHAAASHPLVNMQYLRDYLSKLYAGAPQYVAAAEPDSIMYSSPLHSSAQLHKLQLQQQLHAQLQQQLQAQLQKQQQAQLQQQQRSSSVAALLQEQHRQRVAAAQQQQQQQRTEVTVHRSPAMSPQDYKESVEQEAA